MRHKVDLAQEKNKFFYKVSWILFHRTLDDQV
jgi:hypothetical protein